jgi:hypothetical protein
MPSRYRAAPLVRAVLVTALAAGGCSSERTTAPAAPAPIHVAYLDNLYRLAVLHVGEEGATRTGVYGAVPLAAGSGGLVYADDAGTLMRFTIGDAAPEPLPLPVPATRQAAALAADGRTLAWMAVGDGGVFVHFADTETGERDSLDMFGTTEPTTLLRMLGTTPVLSPNGDRVGFLIESTISMYLVVVHRADLRPEVRQLDVRTSAVEPLVGWPRWLPNDAIRFAARLWNAETGRTDSVGVVEVRPFEDATQARLRYAAAPPTSIPVDAVRGYSTSADGEAVVFMLASAGREGVFLLRNGADRVEPLVFGEGLSPHYPIIVPPREP